MSAFWSLAPFVTKLSTFIRYLMILGTPNGQHFFPFFLSTLTKVESFELCETQIPLYNLTFMKNYDRCYVGHSLNECRRCDRRQKCREKSHEEKVLPVSGLLMRCERLFNFINGWKIRRESRMNGENERRTSEHCTGDKSNLSYLRCVGRLDWHCQTIVTCLKSYRRRRFLLQLMISLSKAFLPSSYLLAFVGLCARRAATLLETMTMLSVALLFSSPFYRIWFVGYQVVVVA